MYYEENVIAMETMVVYILYKPTQGIFRSPRRRACISQLNAPRDCQISKYVKKNYDDRGIYHKRSSMLCVRRPHKTASRVVRSVMIVRLRLTGK
jgi:hypothetical protein